jgi:hypothetical protein
VRDATGDEPAPIRQANLGGVNIAVTGEAGDIAVSVGVERYWTERFPSESSRNAGDLLPSQLLAARYQIVPFDRRRDQILDGELTGWRDQAGQLRVLLIHGPGGQGKTRLATEFASRCQQAGWVVCRARHCTDPKPTAGPIHEVTSGTGLLVVVDYAERWPLEDLLSLFDQRLVQPEVPTRVLLLARPVQDWWLTLRHTLSE